MPPRRVVTSRGFFVFLAMHTTRTAVDNALDPAFNTSISTIERFARALGKRVSIALV